MTVAITGVSIAALVMLYAELSDAKAEARGEATRGRLRHAREALLFEHLWSWAPGYLTALTRLDVPSLARWAHLTRSALAGKRAGPRRRPPSPWRCAPPPRRSALRTAGTSCSTRWSRRYAPASCSPARTCAPRPRRQASGTASARYTLRAMLDQNAAAALDWLSSHARQQAALHAAQQPISGHDPRHWWARRAARTARTLQRLRTRLVAAG